MKHIKIVAPDGWRGYAAGKVVEDMPDDGAAVLIKHGVGMDVTAEWTARRAELRRVAAAKAAARATAGKPKTEAEKWL